MKGSTAPDDNIIEQAIAWTENDKTQTAAWRSRRWAPPRQIEVADSQMPAGVAARKMRDGIALLWRGDYHQARQLLQAVGRRLEGRPGKSAGGEMPLRERFHRGRLQQAQQAACLARLLVPLQDGWRIVLGRAPDVADACEAAFGPAEGAGLIPLREVLGVVGAWQWRVQGVPVPALDAAKIHPHYGVFAPIRSEYLDLVAKAPLPASCRLAFDIGTGTGVIAAMLARRGVPRILATDVQEAAVDTARDTAVRLGMADRIEVMLCDMFPPEGQADLIVCNPPWLPGKVANTLDAAIYDPDSRMLRAFLQGLAARLSERGEGWLILSDLAERLGLREPGEWQAWLPAAGLELLGQHDIRPSHRRSQDASDPLHAARAAEITTLWRLGRRADAAAA